jgi:hypothetical protein
METTAPVEIGTAVRVDGEGFVADGVVRYCNYHGSSYRIGIHFVPVKSEAESRGNAGFAISGTRVPLAKHGDGSTQVLLNSAD